jgi:hypothetical protein
MTHGQDEMIGKVLNRLNERVKELNCIYSIQELLSDKERDREEVFRSLLDLIPPGWQYPTVCEIRIIFEDKEYKSTDFIETPWMQSADILIDNNIEGKIQVYYSHLIREKEGSQFLPEEQKLLKTIADKLGDFIFNQRLYKTLAYLKTHTGENARDEELLDLLNTGSDAHWKWRLEMANLIAEKLDFAKFNIAGVYLIGSTKNAVAGPCSDIDLIVHFKGNEQQKNELTAWIEGWGLALSEMNFIKTGFKCDNSLIDLHLVNDDDINNKTSYAVMIGHTSNSARLLRGKK